MRLNLDTPQIEGNELPADLNRWFSGVTDQMNFNLGNIIADRTADIGGAGAGPLSVVVPGMGVDSIVLAAIQSSSSAVSIQKVTATSTGFDILLSGNPGASCFVNYIIFISSWMAQGA